MVDSIYGVIKYGDGKYGQKPTLAINASPFTTMALDYSTLRVNWDNPVATATTPFIGIRLIRNLDQFPEHSEDGKILLETRGTNPTLLPSNKYFDDIALPSGQFVYYKIWLLMSKDYTDAPLEWLSAGETYGLVPLPHDTKTPVNTFKTSLSNGALVNERIDKQVLLSTHDKFMGHLPAIYHNDALSDFLKPFSFMLDEIMTYADITKPDLSGRKTNPTVLNLQSFQLALPLESGGVTRAQKKLVRDAIWTYSRKGTTAGLERFVENITGYSSTITVLPNLLLSMQDASFYKGVGGWKASSGVTLTAEQSTVPTAGSSDVIYDTEWVGKTVTSTTNTSITLGVDNPVTMGIPVVGSTAYTLYFWAMSASSSSVTPKIIWYDVQGNEVAPTYSTLSAASTVNAFVNPFTYTVTSPATAVKAAIKLTFASANTYRLDRVQLAKETVVGSVTTPIGEYSEPRTVDVFLNPDKVNFISNPSFETDIARWTGTNATISKVTASSTDVLAPVDVPGGTKLLKAVFGSGAASIVESGCSPAPGNYYTFSIYHVTKTGNKNFTLNLKASLKTSMANSRVVGGVGTVWFSEDHFFQIGDAISFESTTSLNAVTSTVTEIGSNFVKFNTAVSAYSQTTDTGNAILTISTSKPITSTTTWARSSVTLSVPDTFPYDLAYRYTTVTPYITSTESGTMYFESAQLEPSIAPTDYFDGSLRYQGGVWSGTTDASRSYLYSNHTKHMARLTTTVMDYLPKNTTYRIRDYLTIRDATTVVKLA